METSTPQGLRRRTLLKNINEPSPLRRSIMQSPVVLIDKLNDENERSNRRSIVEMQRRVSLVPPSPLNDSGAKFSGEEEIADHFRICTKLHAENKITSKVAWQLKIIDLLRVVSKKTSSDTLQVASTSLDIGAKVYGLRVDDIYADGLKLANSMARIAQTEPAKDRGSNDENDEPGTEKDGEAAVKKKKKRRRNRDGQKSTIAKDPKSLVGPLAKLQSVFFSSRINSDMSTMENLFTNRMPVHKSGHKFVLLSEDTAWVSGKDEVFSQVDIKCDLNVEGIVSSLNNHICSAFNTFDLDQWDPDAEDEQFNPEKSKVQDNNVVIFDEKGLPVPELDGSIHDVFGDDNLDDNLIESDEERAEGEFQLQLRGEVPYIVDLRPEGSFATSEYSYNSVIVAANGMTMDQIWAGPSHWKLKCIRRSRFKFTGSVVDVSANKRKRTKYEAQPIDFLSGTIEMSMDKLKIRKKPKTIDTQKLNLPVPDPSINELFKYIHRLILKPDTEIVSYYNKSKEVAQEDMVYKYENPNDSQYCPQEAMDDDNRDDVEMGMPDDMTQEEGVEGVGCQQNFMGDNLVKAPEYVPKTYIPYALQAKRMDMKKLKTAVWQILTGIESDKIETAKVIPTTFSKMYNDLPPLLTINMQKELTSPLAFSALLHLCNDQNLALQQISSKDFKIRSN